MSQCSHEEPIQTGVGGRGVGGVLPAPGLHPSTALSQCSFSWRPRPAITKTIPPPPRLPALEQRGSAWDGETGVFAGPTVNGEQASKETWLIQAKRVETELGKGRPPESRP